MKHKVLFFAAISLSILCGTVHTAHALSTGIYVWVKDVYQGTCEPTDSNPQGVMPVYGYAYLVPGKTYQVSTFGWNVPGSGDTILSVDAPPGYSVYLNGKKTNSLGEYDDPDNPPPSFTGTLRVVGPSESFDGRAGTCTSFRPGENFWQVSLGRSVESESVMPLTLCSGSGLGEDWSDLWTPKGLSNVPPVYGTPSVPSTWDVGPEAAYDIAVTSAQSYEIRIYEPEQVYVEPGATRPVLNGLPFIVYRVEKGASATSLKITRETRQKGSTADNSAPIVLTEETSIERTGTWPNCTWTVNDWNVVGQPQQVVKTLISTGTTDLINETLNVKGPDGVSAQTTARTYQRFWWGYSLVSITEGTSHPETTSIEYYTNTGHPEFVKSRTFSGGGGESFTYSLNTGHLDDQLDPPAGIPSVRYDSRGGRPKIRKRLKPYSGTGTAAGDSTERFYEYGAMDWDWTSMQRTIDGVTVSNSLSSYFEPDARELRTSTNTFFHARTCRNYQNGSQYVDETVIRDGKNPDYIVGKSSKEGSAYWTCEQEATWDGATCTFNPCYGCPVNRNAYRTVTVTGSSRSQDGVRLFTGTDADQEVTPSEIYLQSARDPWLSERFWACMAKYDCFLVPNKSTKHVVLRHKMSTEPYNWWYSSNRVFRTEDYVWDGNSWNLISWENLGYDASGNVVRRENAKGELWEASYIGHLKQWEKDSTGRRLDYTYDPAGRVHTMTQAAAGDISAITTTYIHNALGQILTEKIGPTTGESLQTSRVFDDAGRQTSEQVNGLNPTTIFYNPSARQTTTTLASGATRVETRNLDGTFASVTGTSVVPTYYNYSVNSNGMQVKKTYIGSSASPRWVEEQKDWLGHIVRVSQPGFSGQPDIVSESTYESMTGHLVATTRTGYATTRYEYGACGELVRSGLDVDGNGRLDLGGTDRITDSSTTFESYAGAWWLKQTSASYPFFDISTAKTLTTTRARITGFSSTLRSETRTTDAEGNETVQTVDVDRATATTIVSTDRPGMVHLQTDTLRNGLPVSSTGHDGLTSTIGYDSLLRLASTRNPRHSASSSITYWTGTTLNKEVADAAGKRLAYTTYDVAGRSSVVYDAYNKTTRYAYNARDQVEYQWGSAAYPVSYVYDDYGIRTKQRTYQDRSGSISWDSATWPAGSATASETEWVYDGPSGLLVKKYDPSRRYVEQTYNARGQTYQRFWNRLTDPNNPSSPRVTTTYAYDPNTGEPTSVTYNDGTPAVSYAYTRSGQPDTVTDAAGLRDFVYDSTRPWRLANETLSAFFGNRVIHRAYDESTTTNNSETFYNGHTISSVTGRSRAFSVENPAQSGIELETSWAVNNISRIAGVYSGNHYGAASRRFVYGYETNSRLLKTLSVVNNSFFVTRDFEPNRDLLASVETRLSASTPVTLSRFAYTYDDRANRQDVVQTGSAYSDYGDAIHRKFGYSDRSELTTDAAFLGGNAASENNPLAARWHQYDYDAIGNRKSSNTSGAASLRDEYEVNERNQYTTRENNTLSVGGIADPGATVVAGSGTTVASGRAGAHWGDNILVDNTGKPFYGDIMFYSARSSTGSGSNDLFGSITKTGFLPPLVQSFNYDLDGNLTSDSVWTYEWDAENRLVRASTTATAAIAGVPNREIDFVYDYLGRRVEKRVYNKDTQTQIMGRRYLYEGWNAIAEIEGNVVVRSYTWGLDIAGSQTGAGGVSGLVQIFDHRTDKTYFPGYDGNGNVSVLVDAASGGVAAAYEYSPYGELLRCEGVYAKENVYRFSTKEMDDETGLSYYGHRYYDPHNGRFINRDPIEESGGLNLYGFVGNNPVCRWDLLGLKDIAPEYGYEDKQKKADEIEQAEKNLKEAGYEVTIKETSSGTEITATKGGFTGEFNTKTGDYKATDKDGNVDHGQLTGEMTNVSQRMDGAISINASYNKPDWARAKGDAPNSELHDLVMSGPMLAGPIVPGALSTNRGMRTSTQGLQLIGGLEGFRSKIYRDQAGHQTIGYGHKLLPGEAALYANGITQAQALSLLQNDVRSTERVVGNKITIGLDQSEFDGLVSFAYNIGNGAFSNSTLVTKLNGGDFQSVPGEMESWNKVTVGGAKVESDGLNYRRWREAWAFNGDYDPESWITYQK